MKIAQTILFLVALAAAALLGWDAWKHRQQVAEARAEAAVLVARQDSAKAEAALAQAKADSVTAVLDSLEAVRTREKAAAARRAAALLERADSLEGAIGEMMPPDLVDREIAEAVMDAVREIRMADDERIANLTNLLASTEASLAESVAASLLKDDVNAHLRESLAISGQQTQVWKSVAQPSLFGRLKRDAPGWAISAGIAIVGWEMAR